MQNFIDNEFHNATDFIDSYDPAVGEVWAKIPDSSAADVQLAANAAKKAFPGYVLSIFL